MSATKVEHVVISGTFGSHLHDCLRDAVILALTERRVVKLRHNNDTYTISPEDVVAYAVTKKAQN